MLKKTIKYKDFNNEEQVEDHFFHLSKADLIELEMSKEGGLSEWIKRIPTLTNQSEVIAEFKKLILMAYGKKSEDGRRFIRTQELRDEFTQTPAYSELFMELCTNAEAAAAFINGVVPHDLAEQLEHLAATVTPEPPAASITKKPRVITRAEAMAMSNEELTHLIAEGAMITHDPTLE